MLTLETKPFDAWCIIELLGHETIAGLATETSLAGAHFITVQIPDVEGTTTTELISPAAVYRITACTEETARKTARKTARETANRQYFKCTTAGATGATEPTWTSAPDVTITDNLYDATSPVSNLDSPAGELTEQIDNALRKLRNEPIASILSPIYNLLSRAGTTIKELEDRYER